MSFRLAPRSIRYIIVFKASTPFVDTLGKLAVADPAMGGPGGRPPLTKNYGWSWRCETVCLKHGGKFSLISLTFGHFLCKNVQKAFSFRGALPLDPAGGSAPRPPFRLRALAMVPPLTNPGAATEQYIFIKCIKSI